MYRTGSFFAIAIESVYLYMMYEKKGSAARCQFVMSLGVNLLGMISVMLPFDDILSFKLTSGHVGISMVPIGSLDLYKHT